LQEGRKERDLKKELSKNRAFLTVDHFTVRGLVINRDNREEGGQGSAGGSRKNTKEFSGGIRAEGSARHKNTKIGSVKGSTKAIRDLRGARMLGECW